MGLLTFAINVTLDGCQDHRVMIADDDLLDYFTQLVGAAGAILYGRTSYELMEDAWPAVARDENAPRAARDWARTLEAKPKYVVSTSRRDFPWNNTFHVEGDLVAAARQLKEKTPAGVLVGGPKLAAALEQVGLIDDYRLVVHPLLAGHGPTLFQGLGRSRLLELVSTQRLKSGAMAMHYRRKEERMARTPVEIKTEDGICPASVFRPSGGAGPWPGVIVYMDGAGIRPVMLERAQRLANEGFLVLLPDLFYRAGPYEPIDAKTLFADPEKRAAHAKYFGSIDKTKAARDTKAFLDFLDREPDLAGTKLGATGYCMGGGMALTAA
jgi:dihydrofolate reductase